MGIIVMFKLYDCSNETDACHWYWHEKKPLGENLAEPS